MKVRIESLPTFVREIKRLAKRYHSLSEDLIKLRNEILSNPAAGADLGGGLRKVRMRIASKGKGKSGGARVITLTVVVSVEETEVDLLYIYDKSERESISSAEIESLLKQNGLK